MTKALILGNHRPDRQIDGARLPARNSAATDASYLPPTLALSDDQRHRVRPERREVLPLVPALMVAPFIHFLHEQRFNRDLLYDLMSRPERADRLVPELAA